MKQPIPTLVHGVKFPRMGACNLDFARNAFDSLMPMTYKQKLDQMRGAEEAGKEDEEMTKFREAGSVPNHLKRKPDDEADHETTGKGGKKGKSKISFRLF